MSTTQPAQPIQQPPIEDLRNALQIADFTRPLRPNDPILQGVQMGMMEMACLIKSAIAKMSEPSLAAMQAGEILLAEWQGTPEPQRQLRDTIAGIIAAQISGIVPRTWE